MIDGVRTAEKAVDALQTADDAVDAAKAAENAVDFADFPKTIHDGNQGKHVIGHNNYIPGKSIITVSNDKLLELIKKYTGTGKAHTAYKETIDFGEIIGTYVDQITGKVYSTTRGTVHYSKGGLHIVPARPKK